MRRHAHRVRSLAANACLAFAVAALLVAAGCGVAKSPAPTVAHWPTDAWHASTPESQGLDSAKLADGLRAIQSKGLSIHSLLLIRNGEMILDAYFYPYDGTTVHQLQSVTKSVTTTLVGIAANQGRLRLDDRLVSFFPDRTIANLDARKGRITVRDLASMSSGLDCTADHDEQTLDEMKASPDWVQFALDLPMAAEPGTTFAYCSPGMHLLSAVLQKATAMTAAEFARKNLFAPLGISDSLWLSDPQGITDGWADLYLHPRDAAKIGLLWAGGGSWDGAQVVSRQWVQDSVNVQQRTGGSDDYGYGWWLPKNTTTGEYAAVGRGGQRIAVHRDLNLIVVTTAGGIESAEATDLLAPAMVDPAKPLPANPQAVTALTAAVQALQQPKPAGTVPGLPAAASQISGVTWRFGVNPKRLDTVRLTFGATSTAQIEITFLGGEPARTGTIGLDGAPRLAPGRNSLPAAFQGRWIDATTFDVEYDEIANQEAFALRFHVDGSHITMEARERTHESGFTVEASRVP